LFIRQKIFQYFLTNTGTGMRDKEFAIKEIKITDMENCKKFTDMNLYDYQTE
jgi:hypothetical protein